jgi:pentatricopeptide repeat protein
MESIPSSRHHYYHRSNGDDGERRRRRRERHRQEQQRSRQRRTLLMEVRELLDEAIFPLGSFSPELYGEARVIFKLLLQRKVASLSGSQKQAAESTDAAAAAAAAAAAESPINAAIDLYVRCQRETDVSPDSARTEWLRQSSTWNRLLWSWEDAVQAGRKDNLKSAAEMLRIARDMAERYPPNDDGDGGDGGSSFAFPYDIVAATRILHCAIRQHDRGRAPLVAEDMLAQFHQEAEAESRPDLQPTAVTYNLVLRAWAMSGLERSVVEARLQRLVQQMKDRGIQPDVISYHVLLRYHQGSVTKVHEIVREMERSGVQPDLVAHLELVYAHARAGQPDLAAPYLDLMVRQCRTTTATNGGGGSGANDDKACVGAAFNTLLVSYRNAVDNAAELEEKRRVLERAQRVFDRVTSVTALDNNKTRDCYKTMMDACGAALRPDRAEAVLDRMVLKYKHGDDRFQPTGMHYGSLINCYRRTGQADKATEVLRDMLSSSSLLLTSSQSQQQQQQTQVTRTAGAVIAATPHTRLFHSVVDAWASSTEPDALERAIEVLHLLETDPTCKAMDVQADTYVFNALLKCIVSSRRPDAGPRAEEILNLMGRLHREGRHRHVRPDLVSFNIAIKACLLNHDMKRAEFLLSNMERMGILPDVRTYGEVLRALSQQGTTGAAVRAEQILFHTRDLAASSNPAAKPNNVSYNTVLTAWSRAGDPAAAERMWKIYEQMKQDGILPEVPTCNIMIPVLAKTGVSRDFARADELLQDMERSMKRGEGAPPPSTPFLHYNTVLHGWIRSGETERAEGILRRWCRAVAEGRTRRPPRSASFYTVANGWIQARDPSRAEAVLELFEQLHRNGKVETGPSLHLQQQVLDAWKNSNHPEKDVRVTRLEARMAARLGSNKRKKDWRGELTY